MKNNFKAFSTKQKILSVRNTKWLYFYIYYRFPIGIFLNVFGLISAFREIENTNYNYLSVISFIGDLIAFALLCYTYVKMKELSKIGYSSNLLLLFIKPVMFSFLLIIAIILSDFYSLGYILGQFIVYLSFAILNTIYFQKRKFLFA